MSDLADSNRVVDFPGSRFGCISRSSRRATNPRRSQAHGGARGWTDYQTLLGVTGLRERPTRWPRHRPRWDGRCIVMAPNKTLAAQLYAEIREFFPENAVEYFVSYYDYYQPEAYVPSRDLYIEKDSSINEHIEQMRLSATKALLERRDTIIVATVSCIYGIGDPVDYHSMILHLREKERCANARSSGASPRCSTSERTRLSARYVQRAGRRPRYLSRPRTRKWRCASVCSTTRSKAFPVRSADWADCRSEFRVSRFILPATTSPRGAPHCEPWRQSRSSCASGSSAFQSEGKLVEAQRIEQRTRFDLEMLAELGFCKGIENYAAPLSGREARRAASHADRLSSAELAS